MIKDNVPARDMTPCWIRNVKYDTVICIPRYQLIDHKKKLDSKGDHIFVECDPEWVPSKKIIAHDDEKKPQANKYANTSKTMKQIEEVTKGTVLEIEAYAKECEVSLAGCKTKKEKLEALEKAGKLY
jgi:hypothetical protein